LVTEGILPCSAWRTFYPRTLDTFIIGNDRVKDLEECRAMLKDALHEMLLAYKDIGKEIPLGNALIEQLPVEVEYVSQTA
jgi:hypothetical protein